ncbi:hypothetical protein L6452_36260 [Arctium lappa]|uniref:Uncharacterized protein n=1 Tax=Arctium lappa TaxID=4217 RepID=A0ACB8Y9B6_ARCLA|nr:hypothetical protein L6452_36260 [Arctium lappa]
MDSFFVTGVDPKAIMSQNEEAIGNYILSLPSYEQKTGAMTQLYTPFVLQTLVDSELRSRRHRAFDGPALFYEPFSQISFAPLGARRFRGTSSIRSRLLAPVHNFATDDTRGIFLCMAGLTSGMVSKEGFLAVSEIDFQNLAGLRVRCLSCKSLQNGLLLLKVWNLAGLKVSRSPLKVCLDGDSDLIFPAFLRSACEMDSFI